uniref:P5 protein n=1 Tax=Brassica yellows virus TaxID=1046403 RepID=A0A4D6C8T6_9VIRU|nr:P5 protein [Brassica yellows virus]
MNWTNVDARWYSNSNVKAVPMYVFPVPEGAWSVEISTEGYQPTASTTDPNKGKVDGMIAYSDDQSEVWNVGINQNCNITNLKADNSWKYGHPDMEINNCHFNQGQVLEMDGTVSFHVETTGANASFFLVGPAVQKLSKYNYAVSYGAWTDRDMELGLITVSLDEKDESRGSALKRPRRAGHSKAVSTWETINLPEKENSDETKTSQRQDFNTPPTAGGSLDILDVDSQRQDSNTPLTAGGSPDMLDVDARGLPLPDEEEIPDFIGEDPWSDMSINKPQEEEAMSTKSGLRPQLKPPTLPKPQPVRTIRDFNPTPDLVEAWRPDVNPGYSKEDVAAATIIAGGSIKDGRSMIDKRNKVVLDGRKSWGSSLASSLTGGTLKASAKSEKLAKLTSNERARYEQIKRQQGSTRASEFLEQLLAGKDPDL